MHTGIEIILSVGTFRLGHVTGHFNVGNYRRFQKTKEEIQDAEFFDHTNEVRAYVYLSKA